VGPPNFSSNGFYQVITTNDGTFWSGLNGTNPTPTYIARFSSIFATEFIQNDPNHPPVQFTEGQDRLSLGGWTSAGGTTNGNLVDYAVGGLNSSFNFYGYDPLNPFNAGIVTPFIFNSFDLKGTPGQTETFEALASDGTTVLFTGAYTFSDNSWHTVTENWSGVTTIEFTSSGTVDMDNVRINEAVAAVPEPATMLLLGSGLIGLAGFARKKFKK
jgi:hypothetical protein